jgi:excisionase family DNA binding protein
MTDELLTPKDVADMLRVSVRTIKRIAKGNWRLVHVSKRVRYRRSDVLAWLESQSEAPPVTPAAIAKARKTNVEKAIAASPKAASLLRALEDDAAA